MQRKKDRIDALAATAGAGSDIPDAGHVSESGGLSLIGSAWLRLRRNPVFLIGAAITLAFVLLAIFAPLIAPHSGTANPLISQVTTNDPIPKPQSGYPLGGDNQGRDLLSRLILGSRQTLIVGVLATLAGLTGGLVLGTIAGSFGGRVDTVVMRIVDVMLSLPSLLLALAVATLFGQPSQWTLIIAISVVQIPIFARLLRGSMLSQRSSDHVLAARALGVKRGPITFRHMLPNSLGPVLVQATLVLAVSIIEAASLSFLGLGNPDDSSPEWGQMLGKAQDLFDIEPHIAFWPAGCIVVVAFGFTLMGESLREALDPRNRR
ncbi:ABC transporter permease [Flexivirga sp. B27]